ncbi:MAG: DNA polymerase III subunit delta [Pseudomonadota bacterium]
MKVQGRAAERFCSAPDAAVVAALLHGPDASLIAEMRRRLVAALSDGSGEGTVTRLVAAEVRRDPAVLYDALRARSFFGGRPVVLLEGAGDGAAAAVSEAVATLTREDGVLVVEAGSLPPKSSLRKTFEQGKHIAALGLYPDAPDMASLDAALQQAGLRHGLTDEALAELEVRVAELDRGSLARLIERIALFGLNADVPLSAIDVIPLLPAAGEAETDRLIEAVARGQVAEAGRRLRRLEAGGVQAVTLMIHAGRHFRQLFMAVSAGGGPEQAVERMRPRPVGPRRTQMLDQLGRWSLPRLEQAVRLVQETDRTLRSPGARPDYAIAERCLIRLAMLARRG